MNNLDFDFTTLRSVTATKLIIGLLGLILCLSGQSCSKQEADFDSTPLRSVNMANRHDTVINKVVFKKIEHQEVFDGSRSGLAPFLNVLNLVLDSTQVTSNPTWVQFNGTKIATIQATASNQQPVIYLNYAYYHYSNCTITFVDGTQWIHNKPIYISYPITGNLNLSGPLSGWSSLKIDHPNNLVRYVNSNVWKPSWLPMWGATWRVYTWIVNGQRMDLEPISKDYRTFRFF
jgi:hypothetical protein